VPLAGSLTSADPGGRELEIVARDAYYCRSISDNRLLAAIIPGHASVN